MRIVQGITNMMRFGGWLLGLGILLIAARPARALEPIPEQLVVLTFDDSAKSHFTYVRPLLKELGFGATFLSPRVLTFATTSGTT
jgi:peptidoglycan/xylan/chitin deacetylase (PgdA/CDA1 family)